MRFSQTLPTKSTASILQRIGFFLIGIVSLLYVMFARHFAHIHINLPNINLPIFVGEIILFIFVILLFIKWRLTPSIFDWKYKLVVVYLCWILLNALYGYSSFGFLAFRNAALFYYILFFFIGFEFFNRSFFTERFIVILLLIILSVNGARVIYENYDYYDLTYCFLFFLLTLRLKNKTLRNIFFILLPWLISFQNQYATSKANALGVVASGAFFLLFLSFVMPRSKKKSLIIVLSVFVALIGVLFYFQGERKERLKVLFKFESIKRSYQHNEKILIKNKDYIIQDIAPKLYDPDKENIFLNQATAALRLNNVPQGTIELEISKGLREFQNLYLGVEDGLDNFQVVIAVEAEKFVANLEKFSRPQQEVVVEFKQHVNVLVREFVERDPKLAVMIKQKNASNGFQEKYIADLTDLLKQNFSNLLSTQEISNPRTVEVEQANILFRFYIWRDMWRDLIKGKSLFGINWGKPQRSRDIEILGLAWGEWNRDGWITPHNSFLHMVYRGGIIGLLIVGTIIYLFFLLVKGFIQYKSITGILLAAILVYWFVIGNFLVIFEFPYNAIPIWTLFGMSWAYLRDLKNEAIVR